MEKRPTVLGQTKNVTLVCSQHLVQQWHNSFDINGVAASYDSANFDPSILNIVMMGVGKKENKMNYIVVWLFFSVLFGGNGGFSGAVV